MCYRCAAVTEEADANIAKWQADQLLTRIIEDVNASDWKIYLSGDDNFRYTIFPDYKANRKHMVKPKHLETLREHLVLDWEAQIVNGYEADDAIGIESQIDRGRVVCSLDKDLKQLPGLNYNFVTRNFEEITEQSGWYNFYFQLLVGDAADNIKGCPGIGPVKATKALTGQTDCAIMYAICKKLYDEAKATTLEMNAQLLYILRTEGDRWQAPQASASEPKATLEQQQPVAEPQ